MTYIGIPLVNILSNLVGLMIVRKSWSWNTITVLLFNMLDKLNQFVAQLASNFNTSTRFLSICNESPYRINDNQLWLALCAVYLVQLKELHKKQGIGLKNCWKVVTSWSQLRVETFCCFKNDKVQYSLLVEWRFNLVKSHEFIAIPRANLVDPNQQSWTVKPTKLDKKLASWQVNFKSYIYHNKFEIGNENVVKGLKDWRHSYCSSSSAFYRVKILYI